MFYVNINMVVFRTLLSHHLHTLLRHQKHHSHLLTNPLYILSITHSFYSISHKFSTLASIFQRPVSGSAQFEPESDTSNHIEENHNDDEKKKPLDVMFKEAVGLSEKLEESGSENESESELKKRLRKLEREVRQLKANSKERDNPKRKEKKKGGASKSKGLHALFTGKKDEESSKEEEPIVFKELSPDVVVFVRHLYKEEYFNDANFLPRKVFDISCFEDSYGRDFIKFAAEKFGKDNQEIAKWLSGSDLKTVALFGCPTLSRKNIFSAKRLRTFFGIQEDTVCRKCVLRPSCKFVNQSVWKGPKHLDLAVVMRVITLYALEAGPPQLIVPDDVKASVSRLLKEVLKLGQTTSGSSMLAFQHQ